MSQPDRQMELFPNYGPLIHKTSTDPPVFREPTFTHVLNNWNSLIFALRMNTSECEKYLTLIKTLINELENERVRLLSADK